MILGGDVVVARVRSGWRGLRHASAMSMNLRLRHWCRGAEGPAEWVLQSRGVYAPAEMKQQIT